MFAQNGITFQVEKLSKPERLLDLNSSSEVYEMLIAYRYFDEIEGYP